MEEQLYLHNVERIEVIPRPKEGKFEVKITLDTSGNYKGIKVRRVTRRKGRNTRNHVCLHAFLEKEVQRLINEAHTKGCKVVWIPENRRRSDLSHLKEMGAWEHQVYSEKAGACEPSKKGGEDN